MTIQQASIAVGMPASTIRYYEKEGIIPEAKRDAGGRRIYSQEDIDRLVPISCLSATGMSLKNMRLYLSKQAGESNEQYAQVRLNILQTQKKELEKQRQLLRVRLRYLQLKAEYWKARAEGDNDAAAKLSKQARSLVIRMQG